jgi:hypothetical protein
MHSMISRLVCGTALLTAPGCFVSDDDADDRTYVAPQTPERRGVVVEERPAPIPVTPARVPVTPARAAAPSYLVVDWTIEDRKDPFECDENEATEIEIVLTDVIDDFTETLVEPCDAFGVAIELAPGDYRGEASLLTPFGDYRTTPVDLGAIATFEGEETEVLINFPFDSFR